MRLLRLSCHRSLALTLTAALVCGAGGAAAQAPTEATTERRSVVEPPRLIEFADAAYPPDALAARSEAAVKLELTIAADGSVRTAEVVEPVGQGFDEAAREAALRFRFSPAKRDGEPVAARIHFTYEFRLPPPPPPEQPVVEAGAAVAPPAEEEAIEVTVEGESDADRLRESARAVQVIEIEDEKNEAADLGEVLARSEGVSVRRASGLGSASRISLNGFSGDQVRYFLDGIPLDLAGFPFGVANVPVNLIDQIEVYRGVVPIEFGADALGGAINLVPPPLEAGTHGAASYQIGSFGTHRLTLGTSHLDVPTGLVAQVSGFFDYADNDYEIDVFKTELGRKTPASLERFHDAYRAAGGSVEAGVVDQTWARHLLLRAFYTDSSKELQHNAVMTVPYGNVGYGEQAAGASLRYEQDLTSDITASLVGGYTRTSATLLDVGPCRYNWEGECTVATDAEIGAAPRDDIWWDDNVFGRVNLEWRLHPQHAVRISSSPTYTTRTGESRRLAAGVRDPLAAERSLFTLVTGAEYEVDLFDDRLENIAFVKDYRQVLRSEGSDTGVFFRSDRDVQGTGIGDSLRYRLSEWTWAKASYEWATRLPRPDEVFGDGVLTAPNLELEPETSHNLNLGMTYVGPETTLGSFRSDVNAFLRQADNLIVVLGATIVLQHQNVRDARALGVEAAGGWTSPGGLLSLDANVTWLDLRNVSSDGTFARFKGDRIPNQPYLFANGSARLKFEDVLRRTDGFEVAWHARFVNEFFRFWPGEGLESSKQVIASQFVHTLALVYGAPSALGNLTFAGEAQNLTDEAAFDFYGAQRPGRAFYFKTTATF